MEFSVGAGEALLLDLHACARVLGLPFSRTRQWVQDPPAGFPPLVRLGARIYVRRLQLEAWARGEEFAAAPLVLVAREPEPARRPRGRPRKNEVVKGRV